MKQILLVPYSHTAINDTMWKKLDVDRTCQELAQTVVQSKSTLPSCLYGPSNDIPSLWIQWGGLWLEYKMDKIYLFFIFFYRFNVLLLKIFFKNIYIYIF
jgi:hypothetical protein